MEFWKTYFATLGGLATVLGLLRLFGKSLLEQWLKKDYKKWESELEQRLKEDFKRYEDKLDAVANKEETSFNYRYTEANNAAKEIARLVVELRIEADGLCLGKGLPIQFRKEADWTVIRESTKKVEDQFIHLLRYTGSKEYLFMDDETMLTPVNLFCNAVVSLLASQPEIDETFRNNLYDQWTMTLRDMHASFRKLLSPEHKKNFPI